jgi:Holliday junction resolvasome RuvABC endonuclease subunit
MNILALDLATKTGWALLENGRVESGVQEFAVKRGESPGMRYLRFNRWLDQLLGTRQAIGLIVYEQQHHRGGAATEVAAGFVTRVQEACAEHVIDHATVHTATLKKFATGRGNADKSEMVKSARVKFGREPQDDNEADALWILEYARKEILGDANGIS